MGKNGLDERQEQITAKAGALGFYVMFLTAVFVILVQLLWNGSIENVIGETLILIAGGVTCLVGYVKNGIWTNNQSSMSVWQNLLGSVVCSGIFSVLYGIVIRKKAGPDVEIAGYVAAYFLGVTALCFICLALLGRTARKKRKKQEAKYLD